MENVLIIQTAFLGDTALALYLVADIKSKFPDCKVDFLALPNFEIIASNCNEINNFYAFDKRKSNKGLKGIRKLANILSENDYEFVICLHKSLRSTILSKLIKANFKIGFYNSTLSFLYDTKVKYLSNEHEVFKNQNIINEIVKKYFSFHKQIELNIKSILSNNSNLIKPTFTFSADVHEKVNLILNENNIKEKEYIVIAPGSVWATKKWTYYKELTKQLISSGQKVFVIGGKEDFEEGKNIEEFSGAINLAGKLNLIESMYLLSQAKLLVSNDSSPTHFAGLVGCRTICIFGPTHPNFGFYPLGTNDIIIQNNELKCRPCNIHGPKTCPLKHHKCMKEISVYDILNFI